MTLRKGRDPIHAACRSHGHEAETAKATWTGDVERLRSDTIYDPKHRASGFRVASFVIGHTRQRVLRKGLGKGSVDLGKEGARTMTKDDH